MCGEHSLNIVTASTVDAAIRQARFIYRHDRKTAAEFMIRPPRRRGAKTKKADTVMEPAAT